MTTLKIDHRVELDNVNPRPESHGEEHVLAADLKVSAVLTLAEIGGPLLGDEADLDAFRRAFWDDEDRPRPLTVKELKFSRVFEHHKLTVRDPEAPKRDKPLLKTDDATVKGFSVEITHGALVCKFTIQANMDGDVVGDLCEFLAREIVVQIGPTQKALDFSAGEQQQKDDGAETGEA